MIKQYFEGKKNHVKNVKTTPNLLSSTLYGLLYFAPWNKTKQIFKGSRSFIILTFMMLFLMSNMIYRNLWRRKTLIKPCFVFFFNFYFVSFRKIQFKDHSVVICVGCMGQRPLTNLPMCQFDSCVDLSPNIA